MVHLKFKIALPYPILGSFAALNFRIPSYFVFFALSLIVVALASM